MTPHAALLSHSRAPNATVTVFPFLSMRKVEGSARTLYLSATAMSGSRPIGKVRPSCFTKGATAGPFLSTDTPRTTSPLLL
jgi:hypothetical protein